MKEGTLWFDFRYAGFTVRYNDGITPPERLIAGDSFEAQEFSGEWVQVTLKYDNTWYLSGTRRFADGLPVRLSGSRSFPDGIPVRLPCPR